jgi:two-component system, chemotaxis family, chemotaxis protein CheY
MKVLIVDDSLVIRAMLKKILIGLGYEVIQAENGAVGYDRLNEDLEIKLMLVDWNMPVMNGIELIAKVRSEERFTELRIMMVTTETEPRQIVRALELGSNEYVMKPFTSEVIEEKIRVLGL